MFSNLNQIKCLPVDFNKPWWHLIYQQKYLFLFTLVLVSITQIFWSLVPFIVAKILEAENFYFCTAIFALWFLFDWVMAYYRGKLTTKSQLQCMHSIYKSAYSKLLVVDLKYHTHRSSGMIISKIERAASNYEDFADHISFELTPLIMGLITVIATLAYYSLVLALVMTIFVATILGIGYLVAKGITPKEENFVVKDDQFKALATENLMQVQLIRQTFASMFRSKLLDNYITENIDAESGLWAAYINLFRNLGLLYIVSLFALAMLLSLIHI